MRLGQCRPQPDGSDETVFDPMDRHVMFLGIFDKAGDVFDTEEEDCVVGCEPFVQCIFEAFADMLFVAGRLEKMPDHAHPPRREVEKIEPPVVGRIIDHACTLFVDFVTAAIITNFIGAYVERATLIRHVLLSLS